MSSAISLYAVVRETVSGRTDVLSMNVLLQCSTLISKLANLIEQDADFSRQSLAEIVDISNIRADVERESGTYTVEIDVLGRCAIVVLFRHVQAMLQSRW